jgi:uncharacterized delta-60 repeat protein
MDRKPNLIHGARHLDQHDRDRRLPFKAVAPLPPAEFDSDFGENGVLYLEIDETFDAFASQLIRCKANADHYIVGFFSPYIPAPINPGTNTCGLFKFDAKGRLDTSFGSDESGCVKFRFGKEDGYCDFLGVHEHTDGSLFIWGRYEPTDRDQYCYISKLTPEGEPDLSFGNAGHVNISKLPANGHLVLPFFSTIAINSDGSIYFIAQDTNTRIHYLGKLTTQGALDISFKYEGLREIYIGVPALISGLFMDGQKIVIYGYRAQAQGGYFLRYLSDGEVDQTFGDEGILTLQGQGEASIYNVVITADNTLIMAGEDRRTGDYDSLLWECTLQGEAVKSFNEGAPVTINFGTRDDAWFCAQRKPSTDRHLIAIGWSNAISVVIGRFLEDGKVDESFAPGDSQFCGLSNATIDFLSPACFTFSTPQQILCPGRHNGKAAVFALKV